MCGVQDGASGGEVRGNAWGYGHWEADIWPRKSRQPQRHQLAPPGRPDLLEFDQVKEILRADIEQPLVVFD